MAYKLYSTPRSGRITMEQIQDLNWFKTGNISLNEPDIRLFAQKPSGSVSMSDLHNCVLVELDQSGDLYNIDLRNIYNSLGGPSPDSGTHVIFKYVFPATIRSTTNTTPSMRTGSWPAGMKLRLEMSGYIVGKGGDAKESSTNSARHGGTALQLNHNLTLDGGGVVGGGGGAGGSARIQVGQQSYGVLSGGGGAGNVAGTGHNNGTLETGGAGNSYNDTYSGKGGDLGQNGQSAGGPAIEKWSPGNAGAAIDRNGYTLTNVSSMDIRGTVIN